MGEITTTKGNFLTFLLPLLDPSNLLRLLGFYGLKKKIIKITFFPGGNLKTE